MVLYVHKANPHSTVMLNSPFETIACSVKFGHTYLKNCSLYCPPLGDIDDDNFSSLFDSLPGKKLILGDLNAHHYRWGTLRSDGRGDQITELLLHLNLCLLNNGSAICVDDRTGPITFIDLSLSSHVRGGLLFTALLDMVISKSHYFSNSPYFIDSFNPHSQPQSCITIHFYYYYTGHYTRHLLPLFFHM